MWKEWMLYIMGVVMFIWLMSLLAYSEATMCSVRVTNSNSASVRTNTINCSIEAHGDTLMVIHRKGS